MKKRLICIVLAITMILCCMPVHPSAAELIETANSDSTRDLQFNIAIVLQGNTESASDCKVFRDDLMSSGNGYIDVVGYGWNVADGSEYEQRMTEDQLKQIPIYKVAYYSGHGGAVTVGDDRHPVLNAKPNDIRHDYGDSSPIDVAAAFGVDTDNWMDDCTFSDSSALRVLMLASCSQLDSSVVEYYARLMKASKIRVVAGYHGIAPSDGDDKIAEDFIATADAGNSVWYSWKTANKGGKNWAILVYEENGNQYFRIPGFPGNTYTTPSSSAKIYRYADFLDDDTYKRDETPASLSLGDNLTSQIMSLPLTITTADAEVSTYVLPRARETIYSDLSVADTDAVAEYLTNSIGEDLSENICVQHYVAREEIDVNLGILSETKTVLERTYDYYDTYLGIKIADSYIGASIDCEGVHNIVNDRKSVIAQGSTINEIEAYSVSPVTIIAEDQAILIAQAANCCCQAFDLYDISLAYAPTENGQHVLCYELATSCGFYYVNVQTGAIVE